MTKKLKSGVIPRYEMKYLVPLTELEEIKTWLETICFRDRHAGESGCYNIRSLYFDDYQGSSYQDNEIGIEPRTKYRIRIYNCNPGIIVLEQKDKIGGKIVKYRADVDRPFVDAILSGKDPDTEFPAANPLLNRFLTARLCRLLEPVNVIDYKREPFVYPDGDVRITIDSDIAFSGYTEDFFDRNLFLQPILPRGMALLEVKYTEFLPQHIFNQLNVFDLQRCTFSKYYLSEKFRRTGEFIK